MKNQSNLRLFLFLLCTITLLNCKKLTDVEPKAITDKMVGKYTMSEIIVGGQTLKLPYNQAGNEVNGTIEIFDDKDFTNQIGSLVDGKTLYIVSNITDRITAIKN